MWSKVKAAKVLIEGYETLEAPLAKILVKHIGFEMRYTGFSEKEIIEHIGTNVNNPLIEDNVIRYAAELTEAYNIAHPAISLIL